MADDELACRIDDVVLQGQVPTAGVGVEGAHRREGLAEELDHGLSPVAGGRESPVHLRLTSALTAQSGGLLAECVVDDAPGPVELSSGGVAQGSGSRHERGRDDGGWAVGDLAGAVELVTRNAVRDPVHEEFDLFGPHEAARRDVAHPFAEVIQRDAGSLSSRAGGTPPAVRPGVRLICSDVSRQYGWSMTASRL